MTRQCPYWKEEKHMEAHSTIIPVLRVATRRRAIMTSLSTNERVENGAPALARLHVPATKPKTNKKKLGRQNETERETKTRTR